MLANEEKGFVFQYFKLETHNRFRFGISSSQACIHTIYMLPSLNKDARAAISCSQGILFRGNEEISINMIKEDIIEGIIALSLDVLMVFD